MWYMFPVRYEELRINHLPLFLCSDNALRLLVLVASKLYWALQVTSSISIWGCVLKGCFKSGIFWKAKMRLKGIEDFDLEHYHECLTTRLSCHQVLKATNHKGRGQHLSRSDILASTLCIDGRIGAWGLKPPLLTMPRPLPTRLGTR